MFAVVVVLALALGALCVARAASCSRTSGLRQQPVGLDARTRPAPPCSAWPCSARSSSAPMLAVFLTLVGGARRRRDGTACSRSSSSRSARHQYLAGQLLASAAWPSATSAWFTRRHHRHRRDRRWWPKSPVGASLRLALRVVVVAALSLLGSIFLTATANGIGVLMISARACSAGLLARSATPWAANALQTIADAASWVLPLEALYRDALRLLVQASPGSSARSCGSGRSAARTTPARCCCRGSRLSRPRRGVRSVRVRASRPLARALVRRLRLQSGRVLNCVGSLPESSMSSRWWWSGDWLGSWRRW